MEQKNVLTRDELMQVKKIIHEEPFLKNARLGQTGMALLSEASYSECLKLDESS